MAVTDCFRTSRSRSAGSTLATWVPQALGGSSDEGIFVTSLLAFIGAATLIVAQRKLWRARLKNLP